MISEEINVEVREKQEFPPLPENIYQVELLDINAEKRPTYKTRNMPKDQQELETVLNFQFTLLNGKDGKESLRGRNVWRNFVPTYLYEGSKGKNALMQILEALTETNLSENSGNNWTTKELNELIGKQCRVGIKNKTKDNKTYSNIESFYQPEGEVEPLTDEEKEKAVVKKGDKSEDIEEVEEEIDADDIPFD